jgi:hypothetical protein
LVTGGRALVQEFNILSRVHLAREGRRFVECFDVSFGALAHLLDGWLIFLLRPPHDRAELVLDRDIDLCRCGIDRHARCDQT